MSAYTQERVLAVCHWTDTLFSFTATRGPSFRFANGQFVMMGLEVDGRPLLRAYSLVGTSFDETLEFFSIKVPNGPLTSRLQNIRPGDTVLVSKKPVGTLVLDSLLPGRTLYLLATGTGLAPFMSIIRDPETYERYERIVLAHGCRRIAELAYAERIAHELPQDDLIGEMVREKLVYFPTVTREPFRNNGRITTLIRSGQLFERADVAPCDAKIDRVMMCGNPNFLADMRMILEEGGFEEGSSGAPATYVIEKAFVEK
jgi:ferredoxin/flavodoxin---NADP+ reductase